MGRPKNTAQRREQIVDALLEVLAREGYAGATTAAIAREAGLASGLIHYHFASKGEILLALVERLQRLLASRAEGRLRAAGEDPLQRLLAYVDSHVALGEDARPAAVAAWVTIGAEALRQPEVARLYRAALAERVATLEGLCAAALSAAKRDPSPAPAFAAALASAIEGAFQLSVAAPETLPPGFAAPTLRQVIESLLG